MDEHASVIGLGAIVALGIGAQWVGWATRIPSILLLLAAGFLVGPVLGLIYPAELFGDLLLPITSLSVAVILFEGGLSLRLKDVKEVGHVIRNLVTVGAAISLGGGFLVLYFLLGFSFTFSLLESAVLVVTGPTVIIPLVNQFNVKEPVRSVLRWEGIIIDPIGATAAVLIFEALLQQTATGAMEIIALGVLKTLVVGALFGAIGAFCILFSLRKFWVPDALHNPVVLLFLFVVFILSNSLQSEAGLVSVTIMGLIIANQKETQIRHIVDFKENLRTILIAFLFVTLAGIVDLQMLEASLGAGLALTALLIFVVRPLTVLASAWSSELTWKEIILLSSLAPRGIVAAAISSLFGLLLARVGYPEAELLAPITFIVIAGTVVFYGIFTPFIARSLKLSSIPDQGVLVVGANDLARAVAKALHQQGLPVRMIDTDFWKVAQTRQSDVPVFYGNFLQFETRYPDGFDGIGKLLAMTESDDVNSLAVLHFGHRFEQADLYQLASTSEYIPANLMGRHLFGEDFDFHTLSYLLDDGYVVKCTRLSSEFTYRDWEEEYDNEGIPLFFIRQSGLLQPLTLDPITPPNNGKIIFLCREADANPSN